MAEIIAASTIKGEGSTDTIQQGSIVLDSNESVLLNSLRNKHSSKGGGHQSKWSLTSSMVSDNVSKSKIS